MQHSFGGVVGGYVEQTELTSDSMHLYNMDFTTGLNLQTTTARPGMMQSISFGLLKHKIVFREYILSIEGSITAHGVERSRSGKASNQG